MLLGALPAGSKVQHVLALGGLSILLALGAGKLDAKRLEDGLLHHMLSYKLNTGLGRKQQNFFYCSLPAWQDPSS